MDKHGNVLTCCKCMPAAGDGHMHCVQDKAPAAKHELSSWLQHILSTGHAQLHMDNTQATPSPTASNTSLLPKTCMQ